MSLSPAKLDCNKQNTGEPMTRLTTLDDVLFPVTMAPLFARVGGREVPVSDSQAIVQGRTGRVLGVVGREYRLVTHGQALDLAFECAHAAFPETRPGEWQVAAVDAPSTGSTCFIDLQHNSALLDFEGVPARLKPEVYGPFVRVTNSYNRSRALGLDIGYFRKVCRNGLILRDAVIRLRMNHQRRDIGPALRFGISQERLAAHRRSFQSFLAQLQACPVPACAITGFACAVLGFHAPRLQPPAGDPAVAARNAARQAAWESLQETVEQTGRRYAEELGENAYAVLNTVTDLASHPPVNPLVHRDRHGLQRRAGQWAGEFAAACAASPFDLQAYLRSLASPQQAPRRPATGASIHGNLSPLVYDT